MKEIEIDFDTYYDEWVNQIKEGLREHNVVFDDSFLPVVICRSLIYTVEKFLQDNGYKYDSSIYGKRRFCNKLKKQGKKLKIISNYVLWKYLEYFLDLTDYSKCFDISIVPLSKEDILNEGKRN